MRKTHILLLFRKCWENQNLNFQLTSLLTFIDIRISSINSFNISFLSTNLSGIQAPLFQKADSKFPSIAIIGRPNKDELPVTIFSLTKTGESRSCFILVLYVNVHHQQKDFTFYTRLKPPKPQQRFKKIHLTVENFSSVFYDYLDEVFRSLTKISKCSLSHLKILLNLWSIFPSVLLFQVSFLRTNFIHKSISPHLTSLHDIQYLTVLLTEMNPFS